MASRSSAGIGVGITITILGVACLTLFILTIVFLSKYQATNRNLLAFQTEALLKLQLGREGRVVHVLARHLEDLSPLLGRLSTTSHDFH